MKSASSALLLSILILTTAGCGSTLLHIKQGGRPLVRLALPPNATLTHVNDPEGGAIQIRLRDETLVASVRLGPCAETPASSHAFSTSSLAGETWEYTMEGSSVLVRRLWIGAQCIRAGRPLDQTQEHRRLFDQIVESMAADVE